jgi:four helix bundle protein
MSVTSYRDLKVWQQAMAVAKAVYELTSVFPKTEIYALSSQLQRAAVSIPSNIAEGHARQSPGDFARYLSIAMGSAAELETQLLLAQELGYTTPERVSKLLESSAEVGRMLRGLQKSLGTRKQ